MFLCRLCQCVCSLGDTSVWVKGNPAAADTLELVQEPQELARFVPLHIFLGLKMKDYCVSRTVWRTTQIIEHHLFSCSGSSYHLVSSLTVSVLEVLPLVTS